MVFTGFSKKDVDSQWNRFLLLFVILAVGCMILIAGCSSQKQDSTIPVFKTPLPPSAPIVPDPIITVNTTVDVATNLTKPAEQRTQEVVANLVPNGVYSELVTYRYHSGAETVNITITLEDDIITAASIEGISPHKTSARYIKGVNDALPDLVIGKRIDELDLPSQISGSSLTAGAFKSEIQKIIAAN